MNGRLYFGIVTVFAVLFFSTATSVQAHGNKKHDSTDALTEAVDSSSIQISDSLYGIINENYAQVKHLFKRACYDCHTDQTVYPWYHKIPLIKQMIDGDIKEGRSHLDISNDFPFKSHATPLADLKEIKEVIEEDKMPPTAYRLIHWSASFSKEEADTVIGWADKSIQLLHAHGFTDSSALILDNNSK